MTDIVQELREPIPKVEGYSGEYVDEDAVLSIFKDAVDEIERLREALRYYAKNHYPDIDAGPWGPNSNDWGDVARAALGEKE